VASEATAEEHLPDAQRVGQAVAAVGECESEVAQHPARIVARATLAQTRERVGESCRQPHPLGDRGDERRARP
jgi:hypothetical protein